MFPRIRLFRHLNKYVTLLSTLLILILSGCDNQKTVIRDTKLNIIPITQVDGTPHTLTQVGLPFQFIAVDETNGEYQDVSDLVTWHSSLADVASIDQGQAVGINKGVSIIHAQLGLRTSNQVELTVKDEPMLVLQINTSEDDHPIGTLQNQLPVHAKQNLKAIATYADNTSFDVTHLVEWFSGKNNVVNVENGTANMLSQGSSNINATYLSHISNTLPLIVTDETLTDLTITPANALTAAHSHRQFTAIASYSDDTSQDVTQHVTWKSSNQSIATVGQGEVEALTQGRSQITASLPGKTSTASTLTVTDAKLVELQITPAEAMINIGDALFYEVKAIYDDGSTDDISDHVLWQSSQPEVSNVVAAYASAKVEGQTQINASFHGITSNTSTLTVTDHQLVELQLTPSLVELAQGTQTELTVMATYDDDTRIDITDKVTWQTNAPDVAFITHGHVSAIARGDATVYAVFDDVESNEASVTVINSTITALQITPAIETVAVSGTVDYVAQATFTDDTITTTQDVSHLVAWKSISHDIATLAHGAAIGVKPGEAKILAVLNDKRPTAQLFVSDKRLIALQVTPAQQNLPEGISSQYSAIAIYDDNSTEEVTDLVHWRSSDSNIATLSAGYVDAVSAGNVSISAQYHGVESNSASLTVDDIDLISIQVTPAVEEIQVGTMQEYRALGLYSNHTSQDITDLVHWGSSDTDVATVTLNKTAFNMSELQLASDSSFALVTGADAGMTQISADLDGIKSNLARLTVNAAILESLQITPVDIELAKGTSVKYQVIGYYSDGTSVDVTDAVHWINSQPKFATIVEGEAVAISQGTTQIKATLQDKTSNLASLRITYATLETIQITPASSSIANGNDQQYRAIANYSDHTSQDVTELVAWRSSYSNIATIDGGFAHGINVGQTAISANLDKKNSNSAILNITNAVLQNLVLTPSKASVAKGSDQDYVVTGHYSDGSTKDVSHQVHWHNSNPDAVIFEDNHAHSLASGRSEIYASLNDIDSNQAMLTVTDAVVTAIQVTPVGAKQASGTDVQYHAIATYSDNSTQEINEHVSWISSKTDSAAINNEGLAHAQEKGSVQIKAKLGDITSNAAQLDVTNATVDSIQVTPAVQTVALGVGQQYTAVATYSDGTVQDATHQVAWRSSDTLNATVVDGVAETHQQGIAEITASLDGTRSNSAKLTVSNKTLDKLQLTPTTIELAKGTSELLRVQATYSDGSTHDVTDNVRWQLSDNSIASINAIRGSITATEQGNVSLTARWDSDNIESNTANITVSPAQLNSLIITPEWHEIIAHDSRGFEAYGIYSDNTSQNITDLVNWSSNDLTIATILKGKVAALAAGEVIISARYENVNAIAAKATVVADELLRITVTPATIKIANGTTQQFIAMADYSSGYKKNITYDTNLSWQSSSPDLTIDSNGLATAISIQNGITVKAIKSPENESDEATANVINASIRSLEIKQVEDHISNVLTPRSRRQLFAYVTFEDDLVQNVTSLVNWHEDSQSKIATVVKGKVTTVAPGSVNISAKYDGIIAANFEIEVRAPGNYSCEGNDITIPFEGNNITFMCPLNTTDYVKDPNIEDPKRVRVSDGKSGEYGMTIPMIYQKEAAAYCQSQGYRLPTVDEYLALPLIANQQHQSVYSIYEQYGWPTGGYFISSTPVDDNEKRLWLAGINKAGGKIPRWAHNQRQYWTCIKSAVNL